MWLRWSKLGEAVSAKKVEHTAARRGGLRACVLGLARERVAACIIR